MMCSLRNEWLKRATEYLQVPIREHARLSVPSKLHITMTYVDGRAIGEAEYPDPAGRNLIGIDERAGFLANGRPWFVLGVVIHELIHACGYWNHGPAFQQRAMMMGLRFPSGQRRLAGFDGVEDESRLPGYAREIVYRLGPFPTPEQERAVYPREDMEWDRLVNELFHSTPIRASVSMNASELRRKERQALAQHTGNSLRQTSRTLKPMQSSLRATQFDG